jgi:phosphoribosyl 1,2-cyclic phosphodiesterase
MDVPGAQVSQAPSHDGATAHGSLCDEAALCVLASSSKGNCSVLVLGRAEHRRLVLIDAGLSPRRTTELLEELGLAAIPIHGVLLTHLDHDHWHSGWVAALPERASVYLHKHHRSRANRMGVLYITTRIFEGDFDLIPGVRVRPALMSHDSLGAAAFRIDFEHSGRSLGFATDLGRANQRLIDHLTGVDVLAIESNYCHKLQVASGRPEFLQRRIMDGSGHLSNEQAADAIKAIGPREHVVLLHLSQDCNTPERASMYHDGSRYTVTIADWEKPTPWIRLTWPDARRAEVVVKSEAPAPATLWG